MIKEVETIRIKNTVKVNFMPEIKSMFPGLLGIILRHVFPKIEKKLIQDIIALFERLLIARENDRTTN